MLWTVHARRETRRRRIALLCSSSSSGSKRSGDTPIAASSLPHPFIAMVSSRPSGAEILARYLGITDCLTARLSCCQPLGHRLRAPRTLRSSRRSSSRRDGSTHGSLNRHIRTTCSAARSSRPRCSLPTAATPWIDGQSVSRLAARTGSRVRSYGRSAALRKKLPQGLHGRRSTPN